MSGLLDLNHTRNLDFASVLQIAKFVPSSRHNETNFAIRTLGSPHAEPSPGPYPHPHPDYPTACTPEQIAARGERRPVNVALQGGGSHGAFTWGVLDKLLEDGRLAIDAVSATSAGAMNAVAMAAGASEGGNAGARAKLKEFWREISRAGSIYGPVQPSSLQKWCLLR